MFHESKLGWLPQKMGLVENYEDFELEKVVDEHRLVDPLTEIQKKTPIIKKIMNQRKK